MAQKVEDVYTKVEFEDLLDEADDNASGRWDENFVSDIRGRYDEHGIRMFLSEKQDEILQKIANGD